MKASEIQQVKKLGPYATYFALLKGFVAIGFLWMPKNCLNGGWLFSFFSMILSFSITYYCLVKLLQAKLATPGATSFADVARAALGKYGMWITDFLIALMQYGFVVALLFFTISNLKSVADGIFSEPVDIIYVGIFVFTVAAPLCLVRRIETFAFSYIFADALVFITAITILVFATIHIKEKGWKWGDGVNLINESTWLTMIGSSIYSFEGVGVVLPILDVCEDQTKFPKILFAVMVTNVFLYTIFGEYCLFVYGSELVGKPLITMNLPNNPIIYALKAVFCVSVIISLSLCSFPAHTICEHYAYKNMKNGPLKTWIINF